MQDQERQVGANHHKGDLNDAHGAPGLHQVARQGVGQERQQVGVESGLHAGARPIDRSQAAEDDGNAKDEEGGIEQVRGRQTPAPGRGLRGQQHDPPTRRQPRQRQVRDSLAQVDVEVEEWRKRRDGDPGRETKQRVERDKQQRKGRGHQRHGQRQALRIPEGEAKRQPQDDHQGDKARLLQPGPPGFETHIHGPTEPKMSLYIASTPATCWASV